jgi:hypothetical protein
MMEVPTIEEEEGTEIAEEGMVESGMTTTKATQEEAGVLREEAMTTNEVEIIKAEEVTTTMTIFLKAAAEVAEEAMINAEEVAMTTMKTAVETEVVAEEDMVAPIAPMEVCSSMLVQWEKALIYARRLILFALVWFFRR